MKIFVKHPKRISEEFMVVFEGTTCKAFIVGFEVPIFFLIFKKTAFLKVIILAMCVSLSDFM